MMKKILTILSFLSFLVTARAQNVSIGTQQWMAKNLDVTFYRNGDPIPEVKDSATWAKLTTGAWCYYNNDSTQGATYGKLYNWYAVHDSRGLAPIGYHISTDAEWTILIDYLGGNDKAGKKMKEGGSSRFKGLPGGLRSREFTSVGISCSWWSSTEYFKPWALFITLYPIDGSFYRNSNSMNNGFSVRCLKD